MIRPSAAMLLLFALSSLAAAEDWPRWRGVRGDGTWKAPAIREDWPETLRQHWRSEIGGGYSGITVAGNRVYTMDRPKDSETERVLCFDAATGRQIWAYQYAVDYADMKYNNGPRASVTIDGDLVFTLGAVGHAHCLDAATGRVLWSIDAMGTLGSKRPQWGFAASPVVDGKKVLLHVGAMPGGTVLAVDRETGRELWRGGDDPAGYCTPIIIEHEGARRLIVWSPESVLSMSPEDGNVHWRFEYPIRFGVSIASPIFHEGLLLVTSYWHGARALRLFKDPSKYELAWSTDELRVRGLMSQPLYRDGHAYLIERKDGLVCFEYGSGKVKWAETSVTNFRSNPQASLIALHGTDRVLMLNAEGQLILAQITPEKYREIVRRPIIDKTWAHPAVSGARLFARSDTQIICVELPAADGAE